MALAIEVVALATHFKSEALATHLVALTIAQFYVAYLILAALLHISTHETTRL